MLLSSGATAASSTMPSFQISTSVRTQTHVDHSMSITTRGLQAVAAAAACRHQEIQKGLTWTDEDRVRVLRSQGEGRGCVQRAAPTLHGLFPKTSVGIQEARRNIGLGWHRRHAHRRRRLARRGGWGCCDSRPGQGRSDQGTLACAVNRRQQRGGTRTVPSVPLRGNHRRAAMGNRWRRVRTLRDRRENGGDVGEYRARRHGGAPVVSQLGLRAPGGGQGGTRASAARGAHEQACAASPG